MDKKAASGDVKIDWGYASPDGKKFYGPDKPNGANVVPPTVRQSKTWDENGWKDWALAGGGGLLGYAIADSLTGDSDKPALWKKLLKILALGAGSYGLYQIGKGMNAAAPASATKKAAAEGVTPVAYINGTQVAAGENIDRGSLQRAANNARDKGISIGESAEALKNEAESNSTANSWGVGGFGAGSLFSAAAWRNYANEAKRRWDAIADSVNRAIIKNNLNRTPNITGKTVQSAPFMNSVGNALKDPNVRAAGKEFAYNIQGAGRAAAKVARKGRLAGAAAIGTGALALWNALIGNAESSNAENLGELYDALTQEGRDLRIQEQ